jgi:tRNA uridine 5-carboxymethylaminomethyl modification enzyme
MRREFDIVVIGGGHAGVEAAHAAARLGAASALVTLRRDVIAQMSCNPAIGGVGKGQIVCEIDALGGVMGLAADATGIQFRLLNRSKGPAVRGPRCQSDRHAYARWMQETLAGVDGLTLIEGEATDVLVESQPRARVCGVRVRCDDGERDLACRAAIVTAGTFLNGVLHEGEKIWPGGRIGEAAASRLGDSLRACGVKLERLKTGTCPRLAAGTIDYDQCDRQDGDVEPTPFSFLHQRLEVEQIPCWLTSTNDSVHELVRANLDRAPLYTGQIQAKGPRYCPSFETKILRFEQKRSHLLFLEPEGASTDWVYVNGLSTSLPVEIQREMLRRVPGLERAEVRQWGYAIEYDHAPPTQLLPSLEVKDIRGLYLAGQVNGTTGYEEAAALGLMAGLNAARQLAGKDDVILGREQAYIGVMIDDLVTKGVDEPYRMFTSRAEHRLNLRADNADRRLTPLGREVALVDDERWRRYQAARLAGEALRRDGRSLWELLRRPKVTLDDLLDGDAEAAAIIGPLLTEQGRAVRSIAVDAAYAGYLAKQAGALRHMQDLDAKKLPGSLNYSRVPQLRHEARERLAAVRPRSLGQALRVSGITPADISILSIHLRRLQSQNG